MDIKDILGDLTSPGDTATVLLAGTVGFVLDAGLNVAGFLEPGYVGFTFASSALGLKRAWEANWGRKRALENHRKAVKEKGQRIRAFMTKVGRNDLAQEIDRELLLLDAEAHTPERAEQLITQIADRI